MEGLRIPNEERQKFSHPLGKLFSGTREETLSEVETFLKEYLSAGFSLNVYSVGDIVTMDFINNNFLKKFIKLSIIDEKTQRKIIRISFEDFFEEVYEFINPQGIIRKESFDLLNKIIGSNKRTLLKIIEGEEDLLVLPLVREIILKEGTKNFVVYGQPPITDAKEPIPEGIVIIDIDPMIKEKVDKLIKIMVQC